MDDRYIELWHRAVLLARENGMYLSIHPNGMYMLKRICWNKPMELVFETRDLRRMIAEVSIQCIPVMQPDRQAVLTEALLLDQGVKDVDGSTIPAKALSDAQGAFCDLAEPSLSLAPRKRVGGDMRALRGASNYAN